jgi:hypothetical protein
MNMPLTEMITRSSVRPLALALLLLLSIPVQAAEAVGKLQFVAGEVEAISPDGRIRQLKKGDRLYTGDTIKSGAGGTAQVIMRDRSRLLVRTGTAFEIKEFHFDPQKPADARSVITLQHGAIRSVSGRGDKAGKQFIETPLATVSAAIGDREVIHVEPDATGTTTVESLPLGTFSKIYAGEAVVESPQGTLRIGLQQVGHVGGKVDHAQKPVSIGELPRPLEKRIASSRGQAKMMPVTIKGSDDAPTSALIDVTELPKPGGPIPIPYPNVGAMSSDGKQKSKNTNSREDKQFSGFGISHGDEPGGIKSGKTISNITLKPDSGKVKVVGQPAIRQGDFMLGKSKTTPAPGGNKIAPSQTRILVAP